MKKTSFAHLLGKRINYLQIDQEVKLDMRKIQSKLIQLEKNMKINVSQLQGQNSYNSKTTHHSFFGYLKSWVLIILIGSMTTMGGIALIRNTDTELNMQFGENQLLHIKGNRPASQPPKTNDCLPSEESSHILNCDNRQLH